jgi:hypothetical protein
MAGCGDPLCSAHRDTDRSSLGSKKRRSDGMESLLEKVVTLVFPLAEEKNMQHRFFLFCFEIASYYVATLSTHDHTAFVPGCWDSRYVPLCPATEISELY